MKREVDASRENQKRNRMCDARTRGRFAEELAVGNKISRNFSRNVGKVFRKGDAV